MKPVIGLSNILITVYVCEGVKCNAYKVAWQKYRLTIEASTHVGDFALSLSLYQFRHVRFFGYISRQYNQLYATRLVRSRVWHVPVTQVPVPRCQVPENRIRYSLRPCADLPGLTSEFRMCDCRFVNDIETGCGTGGEYEIEVIANVYWKRTGPDHACVRPSFGKCISDRSFTNNDQRFRRDNLLTYDCSIKSTTSIMLSRYGKKEEKERKKYS